MSWAYYNDNDPFVVEWLKNLITRGLVAPGEVDNRSIKDVRPEEIQDFNQCHFFAGIGGWSYALRMAGVSDDANIWTGSCPCQPFSNAGKQQAEQDERHLWPDFKHLIKECSPSVVFGEQVASKLGRNWLSAVRSEMEEMGYEFGGTDLCAAGVGAPHIRQRLWWVGISDGGDTSAEGIQRGGKQRQFSENDLSNGCRNQRFWDNSDNKLGTTDADGLGYSELYGSPPKSESGKKEGKRRLCKSKGPNSNDYFFCRDGKWRPIKSGIPLLAHGIPNRVGRLRGYGNAIVPQVASEFIKVAMEYRP